MIIKIDGYYHEVLLWGKKCSKHELKQKYLHAKKLTQDIKDLPKVFCKIHNFEQFSNDNEVEVDFVIDTDTDIIYAPSY